MEIVHLLSQTHLTGAEVYAVVLGDAAIERGHGVTILSDNLHVQSRAKFIARPVHEARSVLARYREIRFLREYCQKNRVDIVHAHSRAAVRIAYWATRGLPTAMVSTVHGRQHFSWGKRLFDHYGERVLAVCGSLKDHLVRDFRMRDSRIRVLGNPIELPAALSPSPTTLDRWLFVTRWTGPKGERATEFLSHVAGPLLARFPNVRIDIAGVPPDRDSRAGKLLIAMAAKHPGQVSSLGFVPDVEQRMNEYDLVVGGGRIALAAIGRGRPALAFGEARTCGLVRETNFGESVFTNFGDIANESSDLSLNRKKLTADLEAFLTGQGPGPAELARLAERIRDEFGRDAVVGQILLIYASARLLKAHPEPIPVLMYHKITDGPIETPHRIFVTAQRFRSHLRTLRWRGFTPLWFKDLLDYKEGRRNLATFPKRPIILTFDDGYENNLSRALPILREHQMKATIFLLADAKLPANVWDAGSAPQLALMTPEQRQQLAASGVFEIGSHGIRHERLPGLAREDALRELRDSKTALEQEFSRPVDTFAFTFGDIDGDSARLAREAGYAYAVNTDRGGFHPEEEPHAVFRINIFPEDGILGIFKKTTGWYRRRYYRRRGR